MNRLELIIERMALSRASNVLEDAGLTGFTVVSALAGFGRGQHWRRDGDLSAAQDMVVIISIGKADKTKAALDELHRLLENHIGVVSVSEVEVLRPDRF
ncbi:MAG: DUF190 domain-containing protein [Pseudomonadota bacterium]